MSKVPQNKGAQTDLSHSTCTIGFPSLRMYPYEDAYETHCTYTNMQAHYDLLSSLTLASSRVCASSWSRAFCTSYLSDPLSCSSPSLVTNNAPSGPRTEAPDSAAHRSAVRSATTSNRLASNDCKGQAGSKVSQLQLR